MGATNRKSRVFARSCWRTVKKGSGQRTGMPTLCCSTDGDAPIVASSIFNDSKHASREEGGAGDEGDQDGGARAAKLRDAVFLAVTLRQAPRRPSELDDEHGEGRKGGRLQGEGGEGDVFACLTRLRVLGRADAAAGRLQKEGRDAVWRWIELDSWPRMLRKKKRSHSEVTKILASQWVLIPNRPFLMTSSG